MEYTAIYVWMFKFNFAGPAVRTYLPPFTAIFDLAYNTATIPGYSNVSIAAIHTFDLAKYVAGILDFAKWDPEYYVIGDKFTFNELVRLAEQAKGTKLKVVHDSIAYLEQGKVAELLSMTKLLAEPSIPGEDMAKAAAHVGLVAEAGVFNLKEEGVLNETFLRSVH